MNKMILELYQHIVKKAGRNIKLPDIGTRQSRELRSIVDCAYRMGIEEGKRQSERRASLDKNDHCNSGPT
jgi:hypothetical protein